MANLDDKQITKVINKYYSSDDFVKTILNISKNRKQWTTNSW